MEVEVGIGRKLVFMTEKWRKVIYISDVKKNLAKSSACMAVGDRKSLSVVRSLMKVTSEWHVIIS